MFHVINLLDYLHLKINHINFLIIRTTKTVIVNLASLVEPSGQVATVNMVLRWGGEKTKFS